MKLSSACWKYFDNYLRNSSLHGLRYIRDPTISFGERFFWFVCFIGAVGFAGYFVSNVYLSLMPVTVTEDSKPASVSDIPFPTITICNMNKVKRSIAFEILNDSTSPYASLLRSYCEKGSELNISNKINTWSTLLKFFIKISYSCSEIIKFCMWKSVEIDCDKWFNPVLTEVGICCAFNLMPSNLIYKYKTTSQELKYTYPVKVENWNQERGFEHEPAEESIPWRVDGFGVNFGLTLGLDAKLDEYYCPTTESIGFKFYIYNPMTTTSYSRLIPLRRECWFEIAANVKETDMDVRSIDFQDRRCYFNREKFLRFFRVYTKANCKTECRTNFTVQSCGCIPYFYPRTGTERVCTSEDAQCVKSATDKLHIEEKNTRQMCNCLSACFELSYEATSHYGILHNTTIKQKFLKNMTADYFFKNGAILHLYYSSPLLKKYIKKEIFGFSEFLSGTGGLLGLFLGCSILSLVELIYYLSLKMLCTIRRAKRGNIVRPYIN